MTNTESCIEQRGSVLLILWQITIDERQVAVL